MATWDLICACGECGIDPETWECESRRDGEAIAAAVVECHKRGKTSVMLPLCAECLGGIGGAWGGPDLPTRLARDGEACGGYECVQAAEAF